MPDLSTSPLLYVLSRGTSAQGTIPQDAFDQALSSAPRAAVNRANGSGLTPLQAVTMNGTPEQVRALLEAGALPTHGEIGFCVRAYPHKPQILAQLLFAPILLLSLGEVAKLLAGYSKIDLEEVVSGLFRADGAAAMQHLFDSIEDPGQREAAFGVLRVLDAQASPAHALSVRMRLIAKGPSDATTVDALAAAGIPDERFPGGSHEERLAHRNAAAATMANVVRRR